MVTFEWEIISLLTAPSENGLDNVVKKVNWKYKISDGLNIAFIHGSTLLDDPGVDYISYENLSSDIVIGWIEQKENLSELQEKLNTNLENTINPPVVEKSVPWNNTNYPYNGNENYTLVIDNDLNTVFGPYQWNSKTFNDFLDNQNVTDYRFPDTPIMYIEKLLPTIQPFIINDRVSLYKTSISDVPQINSIFESFNANSTELKFIDGILTKSYIITENNLDSIKKTLISIIDDRLTKEKDKFEFSLDMNDPELGILDVNLRLSSIIMYVSKYMSLNDGEISLCKTNTNTYHNLTKEQIKIVIDKINSEYNNFITLMDGLKNDVQNATTVSELKLLYENNIITA